MSSSSSSIVSAFGFGDVKVLQNQSRKEEATSLLARLAKNVEPIMKTHSWKVAVLQEFYPNNSSLLGMNVNNGAKVLIRLRTAGDPSNFLPYEHCLGTLLHELVHMEIGPHNASFYQMLDKLWDEADKIAMKPSSSSGPVSFSGGGTVLGGKKASTHLKAAAALAAERRAKYQKLGTGSVGQRLGGILKEEDKKQLSKQELRNLSAAAAERRLRDNAACRAVVEGHNAWDEDIISVNEDKTLFARRTISQEPDATSIIVLVDGQEATAPPDAPLLRPWSCCRCTLLNSEDSTECQACGIRRHSATKTPHVIVIDD